MSTASFDSALWALGRGTGVSALVLLTVAVVLGVATRGARPLPAPAQVGGNGPGNSGPGVARFGVARFGVVAVHRSAALLTLVLLAMHVGTLLLDPFAQLRLVDLVLPFAGTHRPG